MNSDSLSKAGELLSNFNSLKLKVAVSQDFKYCVGEFKLTTGLFISATFLDTPLQAGTSPMLVEYNQVKSTGAKLYGVEVPKIAKQMQTKRPLTSIHTMSLIESKNSSTVVYGSLS